MTLKKTLAAFLAALMPLTGSLPAFAATAEVVAAPSRPVAAVSLGAVPSAGASLGTPAIEGYRFPGMPMAPIMEPVELAPAAPQAPLAQAPRPASSLPSARLDAPQAKPIRAAVAAAVAAQAARLNADKPLAAVAAEAAKGGDVSAQSGHLNALFDLSGRSAVVPAALGQESAVSPASLSLPSSRASSTRSGVGRLARRAASSKEASASLVTEVLIGAAALWAAAMIFSKDFRGFMKRLWNVALGWIGMGVKKTETPEVLAQRVIDQLNNAKPEWNKRVAEASTLVEKLRIQVKNGKEKAAELDSTINALLTDSDPSNDGLATGLQASLNTVEAQNKANGEQLVLAESGLKEIKAARESFFGEREQMLAEINKQLSRSKSAEIQKQIADLKGGFELGGVKDNLDKLKDVVDQQEADAKGRLDSANSNPDEVIKQAKDAMSKAGVNEQLEARKKAIEAAKAAKAAEAAKDKQGSFVAKAVGGSLIKGFIALALGVGLIAATMTVVPYVGLIGAGLLRMAVRFLGYMAVGVAIGNFSTGDNIRSFRGLLLLGVGGASMALAGGLFGPVSFIMAVAFGLTGFFTALGGIARLAVPAKNAAVPQKADDAKDKNGSILTASTLGIIAMLGAIVANLTRKQMIAFGLFGAAFTFMAPLGGVVVPLMFGALAAFRIAQYRKAGQAVTLVPLRNLFLVMGLGTTVAALVVGLGVAATVVPASPLLLVAAAATPLSLAGIAHVLNGRFKPQDPKDQQGGLVTEILIGAAALWTAAMIFSKDFRGFMKRLWNVALGWIGMGVKKTETPEVLAQRVIDQLNNAKPEWNKRVAEASTLVEKLRIQVKNGKEKAAELDSTINALLTDSDPSNDGLATGLQASLNTVEAQNKANGEQLVLAESGLKEIKAARESFFGEREQMLAEINKQLSRSKSAEIQKQIADLKGGFELGGVKDNLDKLKDVVDQQEADAKGRLDSANSNPDEVIKQAKDAMSKAGVNEQLEARKKAIEAAKAAKDKQGSEMDALVGTILTYAGFGAAGLVALMTAMKAFVSVPQGNVAVVTRFGKFNRIMMPGLNFRIPFLDKIHSYVSIQNQSQEIEFQAITADQANVQFKAMLLFSVLNQDEKSITDVAFKFINRQAFASALVRTVEGSVRSFVATKKQAEILTLRQEIVSHIKGQLDVQLATWGYHLIDLQINDISFDDAIMKSMAQVVASQNLKAAAENEGEAQRIRMTKAAEAKGQAIKIEAEAEAIAAQKRGEGIANFRMAVAKGMKEAAKEVHEGGLDPNASLLSMWMDMLKNMAENGKATIFLDGSTGGLQQTMRQMQSMQMNTGSASEAKKADEGKDKNGGLVTEVLIGAAALWAAAMIFSKDFRGFMKRLWNVALGWIGMGVKKTETPEVLAQRVIDQLNNAKPEWNKRVAEASTLVEKLRIQVKNGKEKAAELDSTINALLTDSDPSNDGLATGLQASLNTVEAQNKANGEQLVLAESGLKEIKAARESFFGEREQMLAEINKQLSRSKSAEIQKQIADLKGGFELGGVKDNLDKLKDVVDQQEADAKGRLDSANSNPDEVIKQAKDAMSKAGVNEQLEARKKAIEAAKAAKAAEAAKDKQGSLLEMLPFALTLGGMVATFMRKRVLGYGLIGAGMSMMNPLWAALFPLISGGLSVWRASAARRQGAQVDLVQERNAFLAFAGGSFASSAFVVGFFMSMGGTVPALILAMMAAAPLIGLGFAGFFHRQARK